MDLVRTLHRLAVLASFRPPPEDLARALCVQVLRDFEVSFVQLVMLASSGQWRPVASFGDSEALALLTHDEDVPAWDSLDLLAGQPTAYAWPDLALPAHPAIQERPTGYIVCLPLVTRGLLKGSIVMGMAVDPQLRRYPYFWETIALACSQLACSQLACKPTPEPIPASPSGSISRRQLAILDLVAEGLTNSQIGHRLGFSESTIGHDLVLAYERLGVRNRDDAVLALRRLRSHELPRPSGAVA